MATRKNANSTSTSLSLVPSPSNLTFDVNSKVSEKSLSSFGFWSSLDKDQQVKMIDSSRGLMTGRIQEGLSKLQIGAHLSVANDILAKHRGGWMEYLKAFKFSTSSARRYIDTYRYAASNLHPVILEEALARGMEILGSKEGKPLGIFTMAFKSLPPPANVTKTAASTYLDAVEEKAKKQLGRKRGQHRAKTGDKLTEALEDPEMLKKLCFRMFNNNLAKVASAQRKRFTLNLIGLMLTQAGYKEVPASIALAEVPEDYLVGAGRPKGYSPKAATLALLEGNKGGKLEAAG